MEKKEEKGRKEKGEVEKTDRDGSAWKEKEETRGRDGSNEDVKVDLD